jgi:molecular chaperone DnaK
MKAEAKANEAEDKAAREKVEKINQADSLVFQTEKQLKEYGDKIPAEKKAPIEAALEKLRNAQKTQDIAQIDVAVAELNAAWTAASEELYKASQAQGQPGADGGAQAGGQQQGGQQGNAGDAVTDAEFEEVK